jgi:hypothetical protein
MEEMTKYLKTTSRCRGGRRESQDESSDEFRPAPPSSLSRDDEEGSCCSIAEPGDEGSGTVAMIRRGEDPVSSAAVVCYAELPQGRHKPHRDRDVPKSAMFKITRTPREESSGCW